MVCIVHEDIEAMGKNPDTLHGTIVKMPLIFDIEKETGVQEMTLFFYDEYGNETDDIAVDGDEAKWDFFWMRDADSIEKPKSKDGRLVRNRNRRHETTSPSQPAS